MLLNVPIERRTVSKEEITSTNVSSVLKEKFSIWFKNLLNIVIRRIRTQLSKFALPFQNKLND